LWWGTALPSTRSDLWGEVEPLSGLRRIGEDLVYGFAAMGSPCELRIDSVDEELALGLGQVAEDEARRIEAKFSRYRPDSALSRINASEGEAIWLDEETAGLIDYAAQCFELSNGLFDITSGILRRIWRFDGSDRVPTPEVIRTFKPLVGWDKVTWRRPTLTLPPGMELDLGGLGKEYAVDCALLKVMAIDDAPVLVNFGGDLRVSGARRDGSRWRVAIDSVFAPGTPDGMIEIASGALTTSGDARRFLQKEGIRYSHILDPRTCAAVVDPPHAVTVAAATCIEAGFLSTLAMLHGREAEQFLRQEGLVAWWVR